MKNQNLKKSKKKKRKHAKTPKNNEKVSGDLLNFRKKAPRRKVKVEININSAAFQGHGQDFKLFS